MSKKYITTTLPYANSVPHIGHAFEFILGDAIARYFRSKLGDGNVHFNIGLDEHGKKIYDAAMLAGKTPQEYLDKLSDKWKSFCSVFNIEYNSFYRTSHRRHYEAASKFWVECKKNGMIYKKQYTGKYCVGCESFKLDKDLSDGKCTDHSTLEIQFVEEENYFFALTKFRQELLSWFDTDMNLRPNSKKEELKNFLDNIEDISVSRLSTNVPWGIPVPGDETQTIYVWMEALTNYLFSCGYYSNRELFEEYWEDSVQIFGPDNLKFQAAIFQGLLSSAGLKHTGTLLCHGTIVDKDGKKMSKTVGNVIDPIEQVKKYGIDAVRYYALAGLNTYGNSKWDEEQLVNLYNAHLADNYGNLLTRVVHLINLKGIIVKDDCNVYDKANTKLFESSLKTVKDFWDIYEVSEAINALNETLKRANQYITEKAPWNKEAQDVEEVLLTLYWLLKKSTYFYLAVVPDRAKQALESLRSLKKDIVFPKIELQREVQKQL